MDKIKINGVDGNLYEYDKETELISLNGEIVSGEDYEAAFINSNDQNIPPIFSGIFMKKSKKIVGLSGNINPIIDSKLIDL